MRRWTIRLVVVVLASAAAVGAWQVARGLYPSRPISRAVAPRAAFASLTAVRDRPHPRGLDADDTPRWNPKWGTAWKGGGRHPVWRGCQRVYDPAMSVFLNTPPSVDVTSGP